MHAVRSGPVTWKLVSCPSKHSQTLNCFFIQMDCNSVSCSCPPVQCHQTGGSPSTWPTLHATSPSSRPWGRCKIKSSGIVICTQEVWSWELRRSSGCFSTQASLSAPGVFKEHKNPGRQGAAWWLKCQSPSVYFQLTLAL